MKHPSFTLTSGRVSEESSREKKRREGSTEKIEDGEKEWVKRTAIEERRRSMTRKRRRRRERRKREKKITKVNKSLIKHKKNKEKREIKVTKKRKKRQLNRKEKMALGKFFYQPHQKK